MARPRPAAWSPPWVGRVQAARSWLRMQMQEEVLEAGAAGPGQRERPASADTGAWAGGEYAVGLDFLGSELGLQ